MSFLFHFVNARKELSECGRWQKNPPKELREEKENKKHKIKNHEKNQTHNSGNKIARPNDRKLN